jgi:hypothetical protein
MNMKTKPETQNRDTEFKTRLGKYVSIFCFGSAVVMGALAGLYLFTNRADKADKAYFFFMLSSVSFAWACLVLLEVNLRARLMRIDDLLRAEGNICSRLPFRSAATRYSLVMLFCILWTLLIVVGICCFSAGLVFTAHVWFMLLGNIGILAVGGQFPYLIKLRLEGIEHHLAIKAKSDSDSPM